MPRQPVPHAALSALLAACGPVPLAEAVPVGFAEDWTPVARAGDPLAAHRPADDTCPAAAWGPEGVVFEVQTGVCAYAAFDQPLPDLGSGDRVLEGDVWHADLDAPEPAIAHVALLVDDEMVWEHEAPIPSAADAWSIAVEIPDDGERLGFHLHNHGFNAWSVGEFRVR